MKDAKLSMVTHTAQHVTAINITNGSYATHYGSDSGRTSGSASDSKSSGHNVTETASVERHLEGAKRGEKKLRDRRNPSTSDGQALQSEEQKDQALIAAQKQIAELKAQLAKAQEKTYNGKESQASSAVKKVLALLSGEPGKPPKYEYKSNSIIETLQTLFKQFRDNKYELDNSEMKEKQEYEMEK